MNPRRLIHLLILAAGMLCASVPASSFADERGAARAEAVLDDLHRKAFEWFQAHRHPRSGQVLDRAPNGEGKGQQGRMASIAATGYFLSLLPDWTELGWLTEEQARQQALLTLDFAGRMPHHRGLLYHFQDWETGERWRNSEVSLLDSAIFFNGCMVVAEAFGGDVARRADALIDRAEWDAFVTRHPKSGKELLSLGWTPEKGLLYPADVRSSEMAMPYLLAAGSRMHAVPARLWYNTDVVRGELGGTSVLNPTHPLFTSYYGLGWHDLKGRVDREGVDLWANARAAALANREVCRALAEKYKTYRAEAGGWWGLSAGDSPAGYVAPNPLVGDPDGTVWPVAAMAALPWLPELQRDLLAWRASPSWRAAEGPYGISPFTLDKKWVGPDLLGIDLGSFALSVANQRRRTVWDLWMRHPVAKAGLHRLEYRPPAASARPVKIIFDTDMDSDCDDAGALAVLHALADLGECEILATVVSSKNEWSAPCVDAINTFYGRPDLPVGGPKGRGANKPSKYARQIAKRFPHDTQRESLPDAAEVYRRVLAGQPDGSVVIVTVGYLTNVADLLKLPAGDGQPSGMDLVKAKVSKWVCMGGNFIGRPAKDDVRLSNNNFTFDKEAALYAVRNWPTDLMFVGREIGSVPSGLKVGAKLREMPEDNPIRLAYALYFGGTPKDRHVADPTTVLYAVRGLRDYWEAETEGHMELNPDMTFEWKASSDSRQGYLLKRQVDGRPNDREIERVTEGLMMRGPGKRD